MVSRDAARANFARFVARALREARARGLSDREIAERTGVGASTFHRWRRGEWGAGWPELQKVINFCEGLEVPPEDGFAALGVTGQRDPTPGPPIPRDVLILLRQLADPSIGAERKRLIRGQLSYLAHLADESLGAEPDQGQGQAGEG